MATIDETAVDAAIIGTSGQVDENDFDDDCVEIADIDQPPRYLNWGIHESLLLTGEYRILISYGIATEDQKRAMFPKRSAKSGGLSPGNFSDVRCYELWNDFDLVGLCDVSVSGFHLESSVHLHAKLESVYLKPKFRKKGLLRPFIEVSGQAISQELMTSMLREFQKGKTGFHVTVEADLESNGGQAAVRILGSQIEDDLERAASCTGLPIELDIIDDAW
ncbi:hypothetical protein ABH908_000236 [Pseudomonas frederiksbergensis]|uniref:hypothetical protein n=1 Tax=Pseudomonas TaxID=286 RepID=UPI003D19B65E